MSLWAIIPACDVLGKVNLEQLEACLNSPCFPGGFDKTLVLYDGTSEEFVEYFAKKFPWAVHSHNMGNRLGFAANANIGLRQARAEGASVILINQDCVLPADISKMVIEGAVVSAKPVKELSDVRAGEGEPEESRSKVPYFCVYIDHKVLDKIGLLEESFISTCEDDCHITRALLAGFKLYVSDTYVYHVGSFIDTSPGWVSGSGAYNQERLSRSLGQYLTKWGIPQEVGHEGALQWVLDHYEWSPEMFIG